jgi:enamine deaminase RidA (YjgF/YER057c/UK114 family)
MYKILEAVNPPALMKPHGYSHAYEVQGGKTLYIAGQVALDREGTLVGPGDLAAQFRQVCENLRAAVGARGGQLTDIVKLTVYVLSTADYKARAREIGGVYREYFGKHFPAMTLVGARDLFDADDGCLIEIEGVAALP